MRKILLAAVALSTLTSAAIAAPHNPLVVWQGGVSITGLTAACGTDFAVGDMLNAVFRPKLDPTEPVSGLLLLSDRSAGSFFTHSGNNQMHGNGTYSGSWMSARVLQGAGPHSGNYSFTLTPASITATTPVVTIEPVPGICTGR